MLGLIQLAMRPTRLDELLNTHWLSGPPVWETKGTCWQMFGPTTCQRNIELIPRILFNQIQVICGVWVWKTGLVGVHVVAEHCQVGAAFAYVHHAL